MVLFDLPAKDGPKNGIVTKAIDGLKKSSLRRWAFRRTRRSSSRRTTTNTWRCSRNATS